MAECEKVRSLERDGGSPGDCGAVGLTVASDMPAVYRHCPVNWPSVEAVPIIERILSSAGGFPCKGLWALLCP